MAVSKNTHSSARSHRPVLPAKVRVDHLDLKHLDPQLAPHLKELEPKIVDPQYPNLLAHESHGAALPDYLQHSAHPII